MIGEWKLSELLYGLVLTLLSLDFCVPDMGHFYQPESEQTRHVKQLLTYSLNG